MGIASSFGRQALSCINCAVPRAAYVLSPGTSTQTDWHSARAVECMQVTDTSRTNIAIYRGLMVLLQTSRPKHGINPICTPNPSGTGNPPRVPQRFERTEWIPPINIVVQQKPSEKRDHSRNPSFQRYRQRPDAGGTPPAFSASLNHVCAIISHCVRVIGRLVRARHTMPWRGYSAKLDFASVMSPLTVARWARERLSVPEAASSRSALT